MTKIIDWLRDRPYVVLVIALALMIAVVIFQAEKISKLELQSGAFEQKIEETELERQNLRKQINELDLSLIQKDKVIRELRKELNEIPTDNEAKEISPIVLLDANASWSDITSAVSVAFRDTTPLN